MYTNCIVCNASFLAFTGGLARLTSFQTWSNIFAEPIVAAIAVNMAAMGISTSFFLKNLNSILKVHASGVELSLIALLSFVLFNVPVDVFTIFSIVLVSVSSYLYAKHPVQNVPVVVKSATSIC
jgi:ABC-type uncharacterized transport system permease subunit